MTKYSEYAEAMTIFAKYGDEAYGIHAEHDEITGGPSPDAVSAEDKARLDELGWRESSDYDCFAKFT